jgi:hypothetical protein
LAIGKFNASQRKQVVLGVGHEVPESSRRDETKSQFWPRCAGSLGAVGRGSPSPWFGQSGEDNGLVGEIAVFTLSFDSLKVIYIPGRSTNQLEWKADLHG